MRNVMKAATLESKFPLLAVENGCIVSKEADVTVAFRVELPELFSVTVHGAILLELPSVGAHFCVSCA